MSFTIKEIRDSQSKVKTGADFPAFVQELIHLGVRSYDTYVGDGHTIYEGVDGSRLDSGPKYDSLNVSSPQGPVHGTLRADKSGNTQFRNYLQLHQQGKTDFGTFCKHAAETGVEKWKMDMRQMTCTYYNQAGEKMLEEQIPGQTTDHGRQTTKTDH